MAGRGSSREARLFELLTKEQDKMGPAAPRQPSIFRETALDTHKTAPVEIFGPSYQNAPYVTQKYGSQTMAANNINAMRKLQAARQRKSSANGQTAFSHEPVEFRSVFKPKPEQEYVCSLAKEHRDRIANSEWALLDTLEVQMFLDEKDAKAHREKQLQAAHRNHLDHQMHERDGMKAREEADRQLEKRTVDSELERYKHDQAIKEHNQRQKNIAMRKEREEMLHASRAAKADAAAAKKAQEAAELDAVFAQLEAAKVRAAEKASAAKDAMAKTRLENEARIAARKADEARQRAEDEALMQQTIATLERQDKEREEKLKAFMASVAARADKAGQQAVAENKERQEREARLIKQFEAQKEAEYTAKEAQMARNKQKRKEEIIKARDEELKARETKLAAQRAEVERDKVFADQLADAEAAAQRRKLALIKDKALGTQDFLKTQMATKERIAVEDDTTMSARERELNARLLAQATRIVGGPKQYSIKLY